MDFAIDVIFDDVLNEVETKIFKKLCEGLCIKGALNPNFLNLTINREKFWL